jgi:hypothetical protein
MGTTMNLA